MEGILASLRTERKWRHWNTAYVVSHCICKNICVMNVPKCYFSIFTWITIGICYFTNVVLRPINYPEMYFLMKWNRLGLPIPHQNRAVHWALPIVLLIVGCAVLIMLSIHLVHVLWPFPYLIWWGQLYIWTPLSCMNRCQGLVSFWLGNISPFAFFGLFCSFVLVIKNSKHKKNKQKYVVKSSGQSVPFSPL